MRTAKKVRLIGLPVAALVIGGGVGIGLAATSGSSPAAATPAGQQVLMATTKTDTGLLTGKHVHVRHLDRDSQPARHTDTRVMWPGTARDRRARSIGCHAGDVLPCCGLVSQCGNEVVFIRAGLDLQVPVTIAIERLDAALARHRLDEVSDDAYAAGLVVLTRVGPFGETAGLSKKVRLELLTPRQVDHGVRLQLRWVATGATGQLFPTLDADLDLLAIDEQHCALSITAVYNPPLGALGAGIDRMLLHRAARATMRALLRELGHTLSQERDTKGSAAAGRRQLGPVWFAPAVEA